MKRGKDGAAALTEEQLRDFRALVKTGVYQELYKRDLLTREQLSSLILRAQAADKEYDKHI